MIYNLGDKDKITNDTIRAFGSELYSLVNSKKLKSMILDTKSFGMSNNDKIQSMIEGLVLGSYTFEDYKSKKGKKNYLTSISLMGKVDGSIIKKAKIIICSYPSTTFLESMISGPTILLYKSEYWKYTKDFNNLLSNLKEANILFENPNLAAKHLNKVWDNVDSWWESKKVKSVRSQFFSEACQIRENSINMWKDFLISQEDKYYNKKIDINY